MYIYLKKNWKYDIYISFTILRNEPVCDPDSLSQLAANLSFKIKNLTRVCKLVIWSKFAIIWISQEKIPIEEVFQQLKCTREGLTTQEGEERIQIFGPNKLEEKKESKILKFLGFMWNPLSWVMEAAAIMAIALANGDGRPPDWQDFVGIICLLVINSTISCRCCSHGWSCS